MILTSPPFRASLSPRNRKAPIRTTSVSHWPHKSTTVPSRSTSPIQVPGKDQWFAIYHRRPLTETNANSREICIDEIHFDGKGHIQPIKITTEGVRAVVLATGAQEK